MYEKLLSIVSRRPNLYEPGGAKFWDDEHISKGMLAAHLDPDTDAATYRPELVRAAVGWITGMADPSRRPRLLDLGCGPGIYAEQLTAQGFRVTGIDLSPRSVAYARQSARQKGLPIRYRLMNYLALDQTRDFDTAIMISCDFGVLSFENRKVLLQRIFQALKPDGMLIFDALSLRAEESTPESSVFSCTGGGYWSEKPYLCLSSFFRYDDCATILSRYVIVEGDNVRRYHIWNHRFAPEELRNDLRQAGFSRVEFFSDMSGRPYSPESETLCAVAYK